MFICLQCVCFFTACLSCWGITLFCDLQISTYLMNWKSKVVSEWKKKKNHFSTDFLKETNKWACVDHSSEVPVTFFWITWRELIECGTLMFLVLFASFKNLFGLHYSVIILVIVVLVVTLSLAFLKSAWENTQTSFGFWRTCSPGRKGTIPLRYQQGKVNLDAFPLQQRQSICGFIMIASGD